MAVKYLLDADLPRALFTGLRREDPGIDVVRVQQVGLREASDPEILALAASEERIVVTKDKATMRDSAGQRMKQGERMSGLLVVRPSYLRGLSGLGPVIAELCRVNASSDASDWENVIRFIPPTASD